MKFKERDRVRDKRTGTRGTIVGVWGFYGTYRVLWNGDTIPREVHEREIEAIES